MESNSPSLHQTQGESGHLIIKQAVGSHAEFLLPLTDFERLARLLASDEGAAPTSADAGPDRANAAFQGD